MQILLKKKKNNNLYAPIIIENFYDKHPTLLIVNNWRYPDPPIYSHQIIGLTLVPNKNTTKNLGWQLKEHFPKHIN